MKPFRFITDSYYTAASPFCNMRGIVFADTIEEAKRKVEDEYGVSSDIFEYDNDIIEDKT